MKNIEITPMVARMFMNMANALVQAEVDKHIDGKSTANAIIEVIRLRADLRNTLSRAMRDSGYTPEMMEETLLPKDR